MKNRFEDILYEKHHRVEGAAWITINRPEVMNAFRDVTVQEIRDALKDAEGDKSVGVIVLTGAGKKAFCSGGDVKWLKTAHKEATGKSGERTPLSVNDSVWECLKPVIARVNGASIGGGHHLHYFCDFSIAAEHAVFGQNGANVGSPASGWLVQYLIRVVGEKKAREIWMLCRRYSAKDALTMGLVNEVVPYEKLDEEVDKWCLELLSKSPSCIKMLKISFNEEFKAFYNERNRNWVMEYIPDFHSSGEGDEGFTAFVEKRKPDWNKYR